MWDILVGVLRVSKVSICAKFRENRMAFEEMRQGVEHEI
jgi:hypothetical protein